MTEEKDPSVTFTPETKEETIPPASIEEGVPQDKSNGSLSQRQRLSAVSKKYDVDGDGKLNEAEQAMRDMDKEGLGYLTNDKVYNIFQQQLRMQNQLLLAKRLLVFFAALLVILAVANIGVAFAAARLAKDTTTQNNVLVVKDTGEVIATNSHADVFGVITSVDTERRAQVTGEGTTDTQSLTTVSKSDAKAMFDECAKEGVAVTLRRTWDGYDGLEDFITLCPGNSYSVASGKDYFFTLSNGKQIDIACQGNPSIPCTVSGTGLEQLQGEPCVYMSDCTTDYCNFGFLDGAVGTCTCNPKTHAGCSSDKECFSDNEITVAQGLADGGPGCYLPFNADCSADYECVTATCVSGSCGCGSTYANYGCANGETCNSSGVCQ